MKLLVLAGKAVDIPVLESLLEGEEYELAQYATVSRGVRRLERNRAHALVIVPDENDESWKRAIERGLREYGCRSLLLIADPEGAEERAVQAGVFDIQGWKKLTAFRMRNAVRMLRQQVKLESDLAGDQSLVGWIEKAGRLGTWDVDKQGKATWSAGFRRILGSGSDKLTDKFTSVRAVVHPEDLEIYDQANRATFDQGWPLDFEYRILVDGTTRYLHLHRRVVHGQDGKVESAYGMVRDVTAEREFENFLFKRDAILQVVGSFAERFLRESDWEAGINSALDELGHAADASRCFIFRKDPGPDSSATISMLNEWTAEGVESLLGKPLVEHQPFHSFDRWRNLLMNRKNIAGLVSNFQSGERYLFEQTHAKSVLLVPVFVGDQWWGFIGLSEHREEREWVPIEIESLTMMADIFGSAILRRSMEDQLMEANRAAEDAKVVALEASKAKSRFLANMSHEIRTPISGILGMAEMTITTGLSAEQREHMDMIRDAAGSLLTIVNDVLDISKIEAEKLELKPVDFEFRTELERTVRPFMPEAERKGVELRYSISEDVPDHVHGDPDRLGQIIRNLVSNSMKFTDQGHVAVGVDVAERSDERICLRVTVEDTGEGVDLDATDVFASFTQADISTRKKHQGTGLGLTISKQLVEMMEGSIDAASVPGEGCTFTFTAWFDAAKCACPTPKAAPVRTETMHLNILLAEDNPLNQKFLTHFLTMFGHRVTLAENGRLALEALKHRANRFDIVLMDIQMPEMGGVEATQAIREADGRDFDPTIPIIALTAYAMKGDKERMLEAGMNDYVSKPVDMKKLSSAIARCMVDRKPQSQTSVSSSREFREKITAVHQGVKLDMDSLIERFEGNMELLKEILGLFLTESEQKLDQLDQGLMSGDVDELGMALHSIANIASHVLSMEIVESSRELERRCRKEGTASVRPDVLTLRPRFVALTHAVRSRLKTL